MHTHPDFPDLWLIDDTHLAEAVGSEIVARVEVHAWPLAVTEDVRLADGRRLAVKTQLPPTVEPDFYDRARSPLLLDAVDLGPAGRCRALALPWVERPTLATVPADRFLSRARRVVDAVAAIEGDPPVHLDLSTADSLADVVADTADRLDVLICSGRFAGVADSSVALLRRWGAADATVSAATVEPGVVHADLALDAVFLGEPEPDTVVDWQRPVRGPRQIDLVGLLLAGGLDPSHHVEHVHLALHALVRLHWAVLCATEVLSHLPPAGYETWAAEALRVIET